MSAPVDAAARVIVAIDPGRSKCGVAVVRGGDPPTTLARNVVPTESLCAEIASLLGRFGPIDTLAMGNGTQSRALRRAVASQFPDLAIALVDEHGSSVLARRRFLAENPPTGWRRLVPAGLRTPDRPYDDLVAELLAREFLNRSAKFLQQSP